MACQSKVWTVLSISGVLLPAIVQWMRSSSRVYKLYHLRTVGSVNVSLTPTTLRSRQSWKSMSNVWCHSWHTVVKPGHCIDTTSTSSVQFNNGIWERFFVSSGATMWVMKRCYGEQMLRISRSRLSKVAYAGLVMSQGWMTIVPWRPSCTASSIKALVLLVDRNCVTRTPVKVFLSLEES